MPHLMPIPSIPTTYDEKISRVFRDLCAKQADGASPAEVTAEMHERGWLSPLDTVIDVERIMRELRASGRL